MPLDEQFWQRLVDQRLIGSGDVAPVRRHLARRGGPVDTAILELHPLDSESRRQLLELLSAEFDRAPATPESLVEPDPAALTFVPIEFVHRYGVLPVAVDDAALTLVAPPLPMAAIARLAFDLDRRLIVHIALEIDVRQALKRHLNCPIPARIAALLGDAGEPPESKRPADSAPSKEAPVLEDTQITASGRIRVVTVEPPADSELPEMPTFAPGATQPVAPPTPDALATAVARLRRDDAQPDDVELVIRAGGAGLDALMAVFPGTPRLDRYAVEPHAVKPSAHTAIVDAVIRFGPRAAPRLEGLFGHISPELRYYAAVCLLGIHHPGSVQAVAELLFDKDTAVRQMAACVLDHYRDEPAFDRAAQTVTRSLKDEHPGRCRQAAQAAGALRLAGTAEHLIELLPAQDHALAEAAHRALVEITRQDFANSVWRWRAWVERHGEEPRVEWLLQGLLNERRHVRVGALRELKRVTFQNYGYSVDAPPAQRRAAVGRWRAWWDDRGRLRFAEYR